MYWDGESSPSVEAPAGDFFGAGFGEYQPWQSSVLGITSGGFYSYFAMPFHKQARITLTNESGYPLLVFFHFLGQRYEKLDPDALYFHAQWRRENPTTFGKNYTFAHIRGDGYFAGVTHYMQGLSRGDKMNFLEGDEYFFVDGEEEASIRGTGTEDYYLGGWYFRDGPFNAPWHGLIRMDHEMKRVACYRFHLQDRINFSKELRAEIEHGQRTFNEARVDYSSVAYWYQNEPHAIFEPLPMDRDPVEPEPAFILPGAVEFEGAAGSDPYYVCTYHGGWSNDMAALYDKITEGTETIPIEFDVAESGIHRIGVNYITNDHNGIIQVLIDGQTVGEPIDTYSEDPKDDYLLCRNKALGWQKLGLLQLTAGKHKVSIKVVGRHPDAKACQALVDCVTVEPDK
jgi:hypothetical protein